MHLDWDLGAILELLFAAFDGMDSTSHHKQDERDETRDGCKPRTIDRHAAGHYAEGQHAGTHYDSLGNGGQDACGADFLPRRLILAHAAAPVLLTLESADPGKPRVRVAIKAEGNLTTSPTRSQTREKWTVRPGEALTSAVRPADRLVELLSGQRHPGDAAVRGAGALLPKQRWRVAAALRDD